MDKEEYLKRERGRGTKSRAEKKTRRTAWRKNFHKKQAEALERAEIMLKSKRLSRDEWNEIYDVLHMPKHLGPRLDQILRVDKIWKKGKDW